MTQGAPADERVLLVAMGGTIAMTSDAAGGAVPSLGAGDILDRAGLAAVDTVDLVRRAGSQLSIDDVVSLAGQIDAAASGYRGVVVAQGTDTIEEVAFALQLLVRRDITIVVTGAMRHASALSADGPRNLADAVTVARDPTCRDLGVLVVFNGEIHAAPFVRKAHPSAVDAFRSSPGPLGQVVEDRPTIHLRPARRYGLDGPVPRAGCADVTVEIVTALLGDTGRTIERLANDPPDALVVEGFGAGHVPPAWVAPLALLARTIPVVLCSRTRVGPTLRATYGFEGSESDLLSRGLIPGGVLDGPKAAVALRVLLASGADRDQVATFFDPG